MVVDHDQRSVILLLSAVTEPLNVVENTLQTGGGITPGVAGNHLQEPVVTHDLARGAARLHEAIGGKDEGIARGENDRSPLVAAAAESSQRRAPTRLVARRSCRRGQHRWHLPRTRELQPPGATSRTP